MRTASATPEACGCPHHSPNAAPAGRPRPQAGPALRHSSPATPRASPPRAHRTAGATRRAPRPRAARRPGRTRERPKVRGAARASRRADRLATRTTSPAGSRWGARSAPDHAAGPVVPAPPVRSTHSFPDPHPLQARTAPRPPQPATPTAHRTPSHASLPSRARPTPRAPGPARCARARRASGSQAARRAHAATAVCLRHSRAGWPRRASGRASRRPTRRHAGRPRKPGSIAAPPARRARRGTPARRSGACRRGRAWRTGPPEDPSDVSRTAHRHPSGRGTERAGPGPRALAPTARRHLPARVRDPRAGTVAPRPAVRPRTATRRGRPPVRDRHRAACRVRRRPGSSRAANASASPCPG